MSQMDGETKTIGGETFNVRMLDPLDANDLLVDIGRTTGPALGALLATLLKSRDTKGALKQLLDGVKSGALNEEAQGAVGDLIGDGLERAIIGLIDRIDKHQLREIIAKMQDVTSVKKGKDWPELSAIFPIIFRGKIKLMYQWLAFAIRVQYQDFF